jgi:hypothetical protein
VPPNQTCSAFVARVRSILDVHVDFDSLPYFIERLPAILGLLSMVDTFLGKVEVSRAFVVVVFD